MYEREISSWGRQQEALAEPLAESTYPLEVKRHELWQNLVQGFAPSLAEYEPAPVFATTVLPFGDRRSVEEVNTEIVNDIVTSGSFPFLKDTDKHNSRAVYATLAIHHGDEGASSGAVHKKLLRHAIRPISNGTTTLGLHMTDHQREAGLIFLPENVDRAKTWKMFEMLNRAFGHEAQRLLIRHCVGGLPSLVNDLIRHKDNPTVIELEKRMKDAGYNQLLDLRYAGLKNEVSMQAGRIAIAKKHGITGTDQFFQESGRTIGEIGIRRIPSLLESHKTASDKQVVTTVNNLAVNLGCGYNDARQVAQQAIGLTLSAEELYRKYPSDPKRAKKLLAAIAFIDTITTHAHFEARRSPQDFNSIVSPLTLQLLRSDLDWLNQQAIGTETGEGMADPILSHELTHELFRILALQLKTTYGSAWGDLSYSRSEEYIVEAIGVVLGYRDSVEECSYYGESDETKDKINAYARSFATLTPEDRERALLRFLTDEAKEQGSLK